ncbi:MAG: MBOAT family protein [Clostridia bacterium]|nr:MBOAT family protein [Clostridia bacterium]
MWYLEADTLFLLLVTSGIMILISGLTRLLFKKDFAPKVLILANIAVIGIISYELLLWSIGYILVTFIMIKHLTHRKRCRKFLFVLYCLICTVPFFYGRMHEFIPNLPVFIVFIGIAYHMLKAIDALYFVYYTEMDIPFFTYANYILFFPTFTAGPIFRYRDWLRVYTNPKKLTFDDFIKYVKRFILGMFKKMVVLWFVSTVFNHILDMELTWYLSLAIIVLSYITVWLDLSGYSDIAIATGSAMGFTVPENFRKPLSAPSFTVFWRNWHITLSDWVREHIFVVLNGKRLGRVASACVGFATMFVMEMWHGFSLPYIVGGVYNGLCLGLENLFGLTGVDKRKTKKVVFVLRCIIVNFLFAVNTLLFTVTPDQFFEIMRGFIS